MLLFLGVISVVVLLGVLGTILWTWRYVRQGKFRRDRYTRDPWPVRIYWRYLSSTPAACRRRLEFVGLVGFLCVFPGVPLLILSGGVVAYHYGYWDEYWAFISKLSEVIKHMRG